MDGQMIDDGSAVAVTTTDDSSARTRWGLRTPGARLWRLGGAMDNLMTLD
jgi:hypothetical protein